MQRATWDATRRLPPHGRPLTAARAPPERPSQVFLCTCPLVGGLVTGAAIWGRTGDLRGLTVFAPHYGLTFPVTFYAARALANCIVLPLWAKAERLAKHVSRLEEGGVCHMACDVAAAPQVVASSAGGTA